MTEDHISLRQLLALTFAALLSPAIRMLPGQTAQVAGAGGWLSALAALPVVLLLCLGLWYLCRQGGLDQAFLSLLGGPVGKGICLIYCLWGIFLLAANARQCALRFLTISYRNGPMLLYLLVLLGTAAWLAAKPVRALARAGEVFFLALAIGLGVSLVLGAFQMEAVNLLPVWVEDLPAIGGAALPVLGLAGYLPFAAVLGGRVTLEERSRRRVLAWGVGLCLTLIALQAVCLGNFGPGLTSRLDTPFFMMVKGIGFEGTFQRVESVVIALWVLADLALLGLMVCACSVLAHTALPALSRKAALWTAAALAALGGIWLFPDAFALDALMEGLALTLSLILGVGAPLFLAFLGWAKKLRKT